MRKELRETATIRPGRAILAAEIYKRLHWNMLVLLGARSLRRELLTLSPSIQRKASDHGYDRFSHFDSVISTSYSLRLCELAILFTDAHVIFRILEE